MTEVSFYHLERLPLEQVLPNLVERALERGWRAVIQAGSPERVEAIDTLLWTFKEESFLAHGTAKDGHPHLQAVWLTTGGENPNAARIRFQLDGCDAEQLAGYERIVYLFDGHDEAAVARAREQWKSAKAHGCTVAYWQQDGDGRWHKQA